MDIVVAAAGKGTRLQSHTQSLPKHIIPIAGRPFLYYLFDAIVEANFRRIFVVGGHEFAKLAKAVSAYQSEIEIILVDQAEQLGKEVYGTVCPLQAVKSMIQGDRFVYTMGDHLVSSVDLQAMQQSTIDPLVAVVEHDEPERYGVIEYTPERTVRRIVEKPSRPQSRDINVGLYTFTPEIFIDLEKLEPSERGELEITDAINRFAEHHTVRAVRLQKLWMDLGRPEDIAALESYLTKV